MKKLLLFTAVCCAVSIQLFSQALSTYGFSAFTRTYTPVSGSFITYSGGSGWGTSAYDDSYYNSIPIGFSFVYCGNTYTSLVASDNGWVALGESFGFTSYNTYQNDLSNSLAHDLPRPILAALWADLKTAGPNVRYATTGTAPNRVFTIEWYQSAFYSVSGIYPAESIEIILYESTNIIDFAYQEIASEPYSVVGCAIGITGGVGAPGLTGIQQYWSLNNASASPTPSMTVNTTNVGSQPATNQVYRWSPCNIVVTATNSSPVCAGNSLELTGDTTGGATRVYWNGPSFTSSVLSPTITAVTTAGAGVYTLSATNGSCTITATTTVTVNPTPLAITGTNSVCTGSEVTLTDASGTSTWSNDASGNATVGATTGVVTGNTAGSATITFTLPTGCYTTVPVTVFATPAAITGPTSVCVHDSIALTETSTGGSWSSGATTIATVNSTTGYVKGIAAGTAVISYSSPAGCFATYTVTVNPTPSAILVPASVCTGDSVAATDVTIGGTWSTTSTTATISGTGGVTGISSGIATITYTSGAGCDTTANITVNPSPATITGRDSVCVGSSITLTEDSTRGIWSIAPSTIATISASGVVTGIGAGVATVTYTMPAGCTTTFSVTVSALPAAISGSTHVCEGASITLTDGGGGTWTSSSTTTAIIGATTGILTGELTGTTVVTYMLSSGCSATVIDTVNTQPNAIIGADSVCATGQVLLSDITSGGTWTTSATGIATVSTAGTVTGIASGTVNISYTVYPGGCYSILTMTVNPIPAAIGGPTSVCLYSSIDLTDATTPGTWSLSNGDASITTGGVLTGLVTGLDTVTYTAITGCAITHTVTVDPLPTVITGADTVCASGGTTTLSDSTTGGTWSVTSGTGTATIVPTTGVVTGGTAGTVIVSYTIGTGCFVTDTVFINPLPSAISGPSGVCADSGTTTLSDATSPGTWSLTDGTGTATIDPTTGIITGGTAGTLTITYTINTGCYVTEVFTVNPLPAPITGPDSVCVGATDGLIETTSGGTWIVSNANATIDATTGVVTGVSSGLDTVVFFLTTTGCQVTYTINVNPDPSAIFGPDTLCASGGTATLTDTTVGGVWSLTDGTGTATISATAGTLTGGTAGTATVTYQLSSTGCYATYPITINPLPTAISGPDSVCIDATANLTDGSGGGTWSITNSNATISTAGVVTGATQGSDTVVYTLITGCQISLPISVNPLPSAIIGADSVCVNANLLLTDTTAGGTWSSASGTASVTATGGIVTGITAGTATISYTLITGCAAAVSVTVNPIPDAIGGPTAVCLNDSITLTDATGTGTWSVSNTTYGNITAGGVFTGLAVGSDTVTYTLTTGCSISTVITIEPLPVAITGPDSVCVGAQTLVTDGTGGGVWSVSNTTIDTISTRGDVTGITAGTDTVFYTIGTGCSVYMTFTVNPLPNGIGGPDSVCVASQITATETTGGGTWSIAPATIATVDPVSGTITGINAGIAILTYSLPTSCYVTEIIRVNPLPTPIAGDTVVCAGATITLTDGLSGTWSISPTTIATIGATTGVVTGVAAGTATVTFTTVSGCDIQMTITVNPQPGALIIPLGDTMLCPGGFVALTANTGTDLTYQWTDGGLPITGATTSSIIASTAGVYGVTVTNNFGCTTSADVNVTINTITATITASGSTTFCAGVGVLLNANTGTGIYYQWLRNGLAIAGATGATYDALLGGVYSVAESNVAGCTGESDTIRVTVLPSPSGTVTIGSSTTFCAGGSVLLTGDSASGLTYQWLVNGNLIVGATNQTFTADTAGTYTYTDTNSIGCGATSGGIVVTVNPLPADSITSTGPPVFCSGGSVVLNAPIGAGYTYQWYLGGIAITGAVAQTYTASAGGSYQVLVTTPAGCSAETPVAFALTEMNTLSITPLTPTSFCWGSGTDLTVAVPGASGVTFQWELGGVAIAGATNNWFEATVPGNYQVIVGVPSGSCSVGSDTVTLTEFPLPNPIISYAGGWLSTQTYFTTYQWYENTILIPGATLYDLHAPSDGDFTVQVTDTNGCQSISDLYIVTGAIPLSVSTIQGGNEDISVYPNPTHALVYIKTNRKLKGVLTTLEGNMILMQENASQIDLSRYADGVYMLSLYDADGTAVKIVKLVKSSD